MTGFIEGESRAQAELFPERLDDYITESNPVRVIIRITSAENNRPDTFENAYGGRNWLH